ncbi:MAG: carboxyl transferase domain-containing protein [Thermodesulfobacteriota bacterium]|nr:carboxyl transferase domain-containing protein [Thermodesulfobacteriota bacterium]
MRPYFEKMTPIGNPLTDKQKENLGENQIQIAKVEEELEEAVRRVKKAGFPSEKIHQRGQTTVWERIEYLIDPGTWCPLHTLFNPNFNEEGATGVIDGLAKISGRWAVVIGFDNKILAGSWIAGQPENNLRVTDLSKRLRIPLVWLVNCSGVKLTEQQEVYANRRGGGAIFFRNAELEKLGIPVLAGIYGTNPAGGGYHGISPTILIAHKDANIAVGGGGIMSGMNPRGYFDEITVQQLVETARHFKEVPPGSVAIHFKETGFFKEVYDTEKGVLEALKKYMSMVPAYAPDFFRVAEPTDPKYPGEEINLIVPFNQKRSYDFEEVLARIFDNSEHFEFKPNYGPEVYTGLAKIDGFLVALIGNRQGFLGANYPEYASYAGIGGKLYRQGLIKMNEFVVLCGRDRIPIVWFQDTTGIDVGDEAEKAELLALGQSLIYSIEQTDVPHMCIVLRKGTAASHYIMGGPTANNHNAFTLGTPTTEIYVMHGETAAAASFARRLVKEKDAGRPLTPIIDQMNELIKHYYEHSRPIYCAVKGFVDEVVSFAHIRKYIAAFAGCSYQNPSSICPQHQMMIPRIIKG